ncbi:MAG: HAD hydrolase-like protein, partial [Candidatus Omnitrophica bacterium]|nr:HAD hydrolase-like protein [Candidatus Omnitrophota bacterium]
IFDLGNVLVDFNHYIAAKRISPFSDRDEKEIFELFFDSHLTEVFEEGKISPEDFFEEVKKCLNLKLDYQKFLPIWNEIFFLSEKNRAVYALAKILKKDYSTAILSNINVLHFDYLKKTFPVFDAFHKVFASFALGARKPSSLIYKKTLEILGVSSKEAFYVDDRPELVEKARQIGIQAFIFRDIAGLKKDLLNLGIKI